MNTEALINSARLTRAYMKKRVDGLDEDQLRAIPENAENNVLWNVGHIVLSNYRLVYRPTGATVPLPSTWDGWFLPGTSPENWGDNGPTIAEVMEHFETQNDRIAADHAKGLFKTYKPFTLKSGAALSSVEEALVFNQMHEGIHIGAVIALRRQLGYVDAE